MGTKIFRISKISRGNNNLLNIQAEKYLEASLITLLKFLLWDLISIMNHLKNFLRK